MKEFLNEGVDIDMVKYLRKWQIIYNFKYFVLTQESIKLMYQFIKTLEIHIVLFIIFKDIQKLSRSNIKI